MVDVLNLPTRGDYLTQGISQGVGSLLEGLAQGKAAKMKAQQYQQMGLPPGLASLEPQVQSALIKQQGQQQRQQDIMNILGNVSGAGEGGAGGAPREFSDEEILAVSQLDPNLARTLQSQKKQQFQERQFDQRTKEQAYKITAPVRKEIAGASKSARSGLMRVRRMKQLVDEGNLNSPLWSSIVKNYFGDAPFLKTTSSQEFDKLAIDALEGAPSRFGGRVTEFLADTFLKGIPNLLQTDEGKRRVVRNLEIMENAKLLRFDAMTQVISENGGVPPLDLEEQIDARIGDQLDEMADEFIYNPDKPGQGLTVSGPQQGVTEIAEDEVVMVDPNGVRRKVNKSKVKDAQKAGLKLS